MDSWGTCCWLLSSWLLQSDRWMKREGLERGSGSTFFVENQTCPGCVCAEHLRPAYQRALSYQRCENRMKRNTIDTAPCCAGESLKNVWRLGFPCGFSVADETPVVLHRTGYSEAVGRLRNNESQFRRRRCAESNCSSLFLLLWHTFSSVCSNCNIACI